MQNKKKKQEEEKKNAEDLATKMENLEINLKNFKPKNGQD